MDKATLRAFSSDTLLVFGLAILLLSTVLPFLTFTLSPIFHPTMPFLVLFSQADLSTFSVTYDANARYSHSEFFDAYWLHSWLATHYSLPVSYLVATFALQVATLLVGFATFFTKKLPRAVTLTLSLTVILLLTWALRVVTTDVLYRVDVAIGYWLNFPSILCVLTSIILKRNMNK